jgi:hypothetical protein
MLDFGTWACVESSEQHQMLAGGELSCGIVVSGMWNNKRYITMKTTITSLLTFRFKTTNRKNNEKNSNSKLKMDINSGFQIEKKSNILCRKIDEKTFTDLFNGKNLKHVTTGYYTMKCKSLDSLSV